MNMNQPLIKMTGVNSVIVDPIATIQDLAIIAAKFSRLVEADSTGAVAQLSIATGTLAYVVQNEEENVANQVADVLIAAMVVAATKGVNGDEVIDALQDRLTKKSGEAVNSVISDALAKRGAFNIA